MTVDDWIMLTDRNGCAPPSAPDLGPPYFHRPQPDPAGVDSMDNLGLGWVTLTDAGNARKAELQAAGYVVRGWRVDPPPVRS